MAWLYRSTYFGPDRRRQRFQVRFIERRRAADPGARAALQRDLPQLLARGLKWVDHSSYFGPDRRSDTFSHFILERRKRSRAAAPPPLHVALRQLHVRVLEADEADARAALRERVLATALLADMQNCPAVGDLLMLLADQLEAATGEFGALLQSELLRAQTLLNDPAP